MVAQGSYGSSADAESEVAFLDVRVPGVDGPPGLGVESATELNLGDGADVVKILRSALVVELPVDPQLDPLPDTVKRVVEEVTEVGHVVHLGVLIEPEDGEPANGSKDVELGRETVILPRQETNAWGNRHALAVRLAEEEGKRARLVEVEATVEGEAPEGLGQSARDPRHVLHLLRVVVIRLPVARIVDELVLGLRACNLLDRGDKHEHRDDANDRLHEESLPTTLTITNISISQSRTRTSSVQD